MARWWPAPPSWFRLSIRAGECRRTDGRCRQAARETLKRGFRQDSEYRTGTRKVLQGSDALFRKPDTACRSRVGCTPDMNQDARAASSRAIARIVDEEAAAVERTAAHVIGLHRTDRRALGDGVVKRRGGILHTDRLTSLELNVAGPPRRSKTEAALRSGRNLLASAYRLQPSPVPHDP